MIKAETPKESEKFETTCDICGKLIVGIENFIDAGDKVVCSNKCLEKAIGEFTHWQNTESKEKMIENWLKEKHKKQKNDTERRCANQRSALASLNVKVSNQQFEINKLKAENDRLREALRDVLTLAYINSNDHRKHLDLIITRIDKALNGESEER